MSDAILFDRDEVDHLDLSDGPPRLGRAQLLWVDVDRGSDDLREVIETFSLDRRTADHLETAEDRPVFSDHGRYLHVTTCAPTNDEAEVLQTIECVVGESWVVTVHDQSIPVLDEFAARASGSGETGALDGPGFLAALLEWLLGAYTAAFERVEQDLEEFDTHAMRGEAVADDIEVLIEMRQKVGKLRRALAAHRTPLIALTHPELVLLGNDESSERFERLYHRFEATLQEARDAREAIVGSFDVLIARDGQTTNQIMKVLTLASVILLPGALLAGVMGMNFRVGLFEHETLFWVVIGIIVCVAPVTVLVAKRRRWI